MLSVSRRPCEISHPKLEEYIVEDFMTLPIADPSCRIMTLASSVRAIARVTHASPYTPLGHQVSYMQHPQLSDTQGSSSSL